MSAPPETRTPTPRGGGRRDALLSAAAEVFLDKGVSEATVSDITEAAGVAKGTFYLYFDSKDHVLAALRERFVDEALGQATEALGRLEDSDLWQLTSEYIEEVIDYHLENAALLVVVMHQAATPETAEMLGACERKLREIIVTGIRAGIDAGEFSVDDPDMTASLLMNAIEGTIHQRTLYGEDLDRDRLVRAALDLTRRALAADGAL